MFSDNLPVILIKSWRMECQRFNGEFLSGPVPSLFGEDPEAAEAALRADLVKTQGDILRIHRAFFMPEVISLEEAVILMKKPR